MKVIKGKIYTNPTGDLVVMCTKRTYEGNAYFEGVVLYKNNLSIEVGTINDTWVLDDFKEKIGPLHLNNVTINN